MAPAMKSAMKSKAMKAAKAMTKSQLADQLATKSELKKKDVLSVLQNLSEIGASEVTTTASTLTAFGSQFRRLAFDDGCSQSQSHAQQSAARFRRELHVSEVRAPRALHDQDSCPG